MRSRRAFSIIWRINAVVILLAGSAATIALVALLVSLVLDAAPSRRTETVADTAAAPDAAPLNARIGGFESMAGTTVLRAPLNVDEGGKYSSHGGADNTRNYLFLDTETKNAHWLLPNNEVEIFSARDLPEPERDAQPPLRVIVYQVLAHDGNQDGRIDHDDRLTLAISDPSGRGYRELVAAVDTVNAMWLADPDHLAVLYSVGAKLYSLEADLRNGGAPKIAEVKITRS